MKIKYLAYIFGIGILIFIGIPSIHLLTTKIDENEANNPIAIGYVNDESHLNLTSIDSIIYASSDSIELINQLKSVIKYAKKHDLKVSIAGTKHSMGGHTITKDGIQLNMLPFNSMRLDSTNNILTIGSGATWGQAIAFLDSFHRSISIMQAFSTFSIGGSISVNGHGWQKNLPPLSNSVESFRVMLASGEIKNCSRTENIELFQLVVGGYGLFGIIIDAKIKVTNNTALRYKYVKLSTKNYLKHYSKYITNNSNTELVFGRLRISNKGFLEETTLNFFEKTTLKPDKLNLITTKNVELKRLVFRGSVDNEYGKRLRWDLEQYATSISRNKIYSRNLLLNDDVTLIENKDSSSTDILHEYFIPERNFLKFIESIKIPLKNTEIDLLNITIRRVEADNDAFLNYAKEPVYGFVILFNQRKTNDDEKSMKKLAIQLVDCAIESEGTYYLPYRLHIPKEKMYQVYPNAPEFFKLKLKYDPSELFSNMFYQKYK